MILQTREKQHSFDNYLFIYDGDEIPSGSLIDIKITTTENSNIFLNGFSVDSDGKLALTINQCTNLLEDVGHAYIETTNTGSIAMNCYGSILSCVVNIGYIPNKPINFTKKIQINPVFITRVLKNKITHKTHVIVQIGEGELITITLDKNLYLRGNNVSFLEIDPNVYKVISLIKTDNNTTQTTVNDRHITSINGIQGSKLSVDFYYKGEALYAEGADRGEQGNYRAVRLYSDGDSECNREVEMAYLKALEKKIEQIPTTPCNNS